MAGMSDYYGKMASALEVLDEALPDAGPVSIDALTQAFTQIRHTVGIDERGPIHDEVVDRLAHGELNDSSMIETVMTMARELPLADQEPA